MSNVCFEGNGHTITLAYAEDDEEELICDCSVSYPSICSFVTLPALLEEIDNEDEDDQHTKSIQTFLATEKEEDSEVDQYYSQRRSEKQRLKSRMKVRRRVIRENLERKSLIP